MSKKKRPAARRPKRPTAGRKARSQGPPGPSDAAENSGKNSGPQTPAPDLKPQAHGGALFSGGQPGNAGGSGRPPNVVRELALEMFANRLPRLDAIAAGDSIRARVGNKARMLPGTVKEQGAAIVAMGRLGGMATKIELDGEIRTPVVVGVLVGPEAARNGEVTLPTEATDGGVHQGDAAPI